MGNEDLEKILHREEKSAEERTVLGLFHSFNAILKSVTILSIS